MKRTMKQGTGFNWALMLVLVLALGLGSAWAKGPPPGKGPAGDDKKVKVDHTVRQERPIELGVSGGNALDLANGYCCSGTLGALVEDAAGIRYILSNTHVFAGDSVDGGNGLTAQAGDPINQPGNVDVNCQDIGGDYVATLSDWIPLVAGGATVVDAAIAQVIPGMVDPAGSILEIGPISSDPVAAFLNQPVKKSGRTSGLTEAKVTGLDATVSVEYSDECAGNAFVTTFTGQILVSPGKFLKPGDSGSLMVENVDTNPRPVGLLYAGSRRVAIANPIDDVLAALGVSLWASPRPRLRRAMLKAPEPAGLAKASQAKARNAARLMAVPGAVGHAVGRASGLGSGAVVQVLVTRISDAARNACPAQVDGVRVELLEVGHILAY